MNPRACLPSFAFCIVALCLPAAAFAQGNQRSADPYPARPIRLVVPFAPGGSSDTITRIIGPRLAEQMGQQVVLDNRSGGNGAIGTQIIARALPDGYTIGLAYIATLATNPAISGDTGYDPVKDFAPITQLTASANVLAVHVQSEFSKWQKLAKSMGLKPG